MARRKLLNPAAPKNWSTSVGASIWVVMVGSCDLADDSDHRARAGLQDRCSAAAGPLQATATRFIGMTSTDITITSTVVDCLLTAIRTGGVVASLYRDDAHLDATVPNWRFTVDGAEAIAAEYAR